MFPDFMILQTGETGWTDTDDFERACGSGSLDRMSNHHKSFTASSIRVTDQSRTHKCRCVELAINSLSQTSGQITA